MSALTSLPWLTIVSAPCIAAGVVLAARGVRLELASMRMGARDTSRPLAWIRGFRLAIAGVCVALAGLGLLLGAVWLVVLAAIIFGEEMLETSLCIFGMTRGSQLRLGPRIARR